MIIDAYTRKIIQQALIEDIGGGDITTASVLGRSKKGEFVISAGQDAVVCGILLAEIVFDIVDPSVRFKPLVSDGAAVAAGKAIAYIDGSCQSVLSAERTALNFLCWLSGIATLTNKFAEAVKDTRARIMDTRKTIPTLRRFQRYAVKVGQGLNHRMGLYDQVLIKDNHLSLALKSPGAFKDVKDAIKGLVQSARLNAPKGKKIEIEIDSIDLLGPALESGPDIIMLDNMGIDDIKKAVSIRDAYRIKTGDVGFKSLLEVSGNVNITNVRGIALCGVDRISIGALTHSAASCDFSLEVR
ncbi:MAG: carboxylating nicotinate-nucleotide diphosphorylase [Candidatus Omnitrophica bacterium]|nr:carboxylating nicotinate-nucleotide diphosphorylase [Candidatus Omnitrophota bacterium]